MAIIICFIIRIYVKSACSVSFSYLYIDYSKPLMVTILVSLWACFFYILSQRHAWPAEAGLP